MKTLDNLMSVLTAQQIANAKRGVMVYMDNLAQCKQVLALGFVLEQQPSTKIAKYRTLDWTTTREMMALLNAHGAAVKVVSVQDKYSDNNGAYEVLTVADANGAEWSVNNMYDTSACFRHMDTTSLLAYAQNSL